MTDIISLIIFYVIFRGIVAIVKAILGGESCNDFHRDR